VVGAWHHDKEAYEPFFGLDEPPFSLAPDPRFLFASTSHSTALAEIAYALRRREPLLVVSGENGTGKTLLCRTLVQRFEQKTFLSVLNDPLVTFDELLKQILEDFGVISKDRTRLGSTPRHELIEALHDFLRTLTPIAAHAVVIVDEAHHLTPVALEQIRLLASIDDQHGTLLQIMLVGQPDLDAMLASPELRHVQQRILRRIRLEPLAGDEVRQYIEHRLEIVRGDSSHAGVEIAPESIREIARLSRGLPRLINLLCDRSLEAAHAARSRVVDSDCVNLAARELLLLESPAAPEPIALPSTPPAPPVDEHVPRAFAGPARIARPRVVGWLVVTASVVLAVLGIWLALSGSRRSTPTAQASPPAPPNLSTRPGFADGGHPTAVREADSPHVPSPPNAPAAAHPVTSPAGAAAVLADGYEVVIASFRTTARATEVTAQMAALGLPGRTRALGSWQQVVCGPFASRGQAEDAQARLHKAGLTGTQIVQIESTRTESLKR
jgi:general secretion pathway protein A